MLRLDDVNGLEGLGVLHAAASEGSLEVCRYLIHELQFDANQLDNKGRTPLFVAVLCEDVRTARYLLTQGADPNKASSNGFSPLHTAAESGHSEAVEVLLKNGAHIDAEAFCGTPLHCAATKDRAEVMEILLSYDADFTIVVNGMTPLTAARDAGSANCLLILSRAEASEEVSEGSGLNKKRQYKAVTEENSLILESPIFSQCYGDFTADIFQCQHTLKRRRTELSDLGPAVGNTVMIQGFAQSVSKKSKKLAIVVLRDGPRTVKCVVSMDTAGVSDCMISYVGKVPKESYIEVHGEVRLDAASNQAELNVRKIYCITRALAKLPFPLEDAARGDHVEYDQNMKKLPHVSLNIRLNKRSLDLRTNPTRSIFRIQSAVTLKFTEIMKSSDFMSIHTPKLTSEVSSEGGAAVFKLQYPNGNTAALAQSPQLYKQMAINGGLKKVFEIAPVYRAEKSKTHRHLCEYVGIHAEMEISEHYLEVCEFVGSSFIQVFDHLKEKYQEEISIIKEQYPCVDLQYTPKPLMLKYRDGIQMLQDSGFKIDEFNDLSDLAEKTLGKLVLDMYSTDFFILYEYPLTLRPFYTMTCAEKVTNPDHRYSNSFDAFIRGQEVLSGSQRIHENNALVRSIEKCGLNPDSFKWFTDSFQFGAPPRGGFGAGLERFVMLYLGLPEIKMASLFPRDPNRLMP